MESFIRIIKLGYVNFWRNRWLTLAATLLMTLTLTMISVSLVLTLVVKDLADTIRSKIDVTVYFRDDSINDTEITALADRLGRQPNIASTEFVDKTEALTIWNRLPINETIKKPIGPSYNPLPRSIQIKAVNPDDIQSVVTAVELTDEKKIVCTECVSYGKNKDTINKLLSITRFVQRAGLFLSVFFGIIAVVNVLNIIRLTITARSDEIEIMRYVGASNTFIRGPFIIEGMLYGILGTIFTTLFLIIIAKLISGDVDTVFEVFGVNFYGLVMANIWTLIAVQLIIGVILGIIVSWISIKRYLKA